MQPTVEATETKQLTALLRLLPIIASADTSEWLKKENPNELRVITLISTTCPSTEKEYRDIAEGVLVRSRIKPLEMPGMHELALYVHLACIDSGNDNLPISLTVHFGKAIRDEHGTTLKTALSPKYFRYFDQTGSTGVDVIEAQLREAVENAVTDYLEANFDLGKEED